MGANGGEPSLAYTKKFFQNIVKSNRNQGPVLESDPMPNFLFLLIFSFNRILNLSFGDLRDFCKPDLETLTSDTR